MLELRHLLRSFRRTPVFAAIAVLTLTLGIGVTTAVMSVVDHVLIRSLPFRDASRLMSLLERGDRGGFRAPSAPTVADWAADPGASRAFETITFVRGAGALLKRGDETDRIGVAYVASEFFPMLGTRPLIGRTLLADDHRRDAPTVGVLSYETWQRDFAGDPHMVGRRITVDSAIVTVVGVMPLGATYPAFAGLWEPISHYSDQTALTRRAMHVDSRVVGRLRPGVDSARAVAMMRPIDARLAAEYPADQAHWHAAMFSVRDEILGGVGATLWTLAGAAIAVLLLACANVGNLLLARAASRSREIAVRGALGASRGRIVRQLLAESLALALAGGALGTLVAAGAVNFARKLPTGRLPRANELSLDHRVLIIALGASILTALLSGVWPAARATRLSAAEVLRSGSAGAIGRRGEARLRRALVGVQFALAVALLIGASLLVQSFRRATAVDVGFEPHDLIAVRIDPPSPTYREAKQAAALYTRLIAAAKSVPGVIDAAFINHIPFGAASMTTPVEIEGRTATDTASRQVLYRTVSDGYAHTMGIAMAAGRCFDADDMRAPGGRFIVNQAMARVYWPGENAIGKRLTIRRSSQVRPDFGQPLAGVVIGVVHDVHQTSQDALPQPEIYVPYTLETWAWGNIMVRTRDGVHAYPAIRRAFAAVDPRVIETGPRGDSRFTSAEWLIGFTLEPRRLSTALIGAFAACALVLAAIGMYGVVSYGVAQRTRELGVRKALGATDGMIAAMLLRESMLVAALGTGVGCAGAWAGARLIKNLLFETSAVDAPSYGFTVLALLAVAMLATLLPARRATHLDPTIAMRGE